MQLNNNQPNFFTQTETGGAVHNMKAIPPIDTTIIKQKAYVGIDPGKSGGIVAIGTNGTIVSKNIMPLLGDDVNVFALYALFESLSDTFDVTVVLEDVHSIFGSSASSNFVFGFVCGAIEAVVICQRLKLIKVPPKKWQSEIWTNPDKCYKPKKPDQKNASVDTKATSLRAANRLFPNFDFRKSDSKRVINAHDGIIDAALMAEYGRRKNL